MSEATAGVLGRYGQALFNDAWRVAPDLVDKIRGTEDDPFYRDERAEAFLRALLSATREAERERIAQAIEADPGSTTKHFMARNAVYGEDGEPTGEVEEVPDYYTTIHGPEHYARLARSVPA